MEKNVARIVTSRFFVNLATIQSTWRAIELHFSQRILAQVEGEVKCATHRGMTLGLSLPDEALRNIVDSLKKIYKIAFAPNKLFLIKIVEKSNFSEILRTQNSCNYIRKFLLLFLLNVYRQRLMDFNHKTCEIQIVSIAVCTKNVYN